MNINIQANEAVNLAVSVLTNIAGAALVLAVGYFIAVAARRFTRKTLKRPDIARALGPSIVRLLSGTVYYLLLLLAAAGSLIALGVPAAAVLAVAAIILVVFAVALQQSAVNFAATVIFLMFQRFRRDELILTMGYMGWVQEILLFDTVLRLPDQRLASMPNSKIHDSGITNYSRLGQVRADFTLTVNYAEDVSRARSLITQIAAADKRVLLDPPLERLYVSDCRTYVRHSQARCRQNGHLFHLNMRTDVLICLQYGVCLWRAPRNRPQNSSSRTVGHEPAPRRAHRNADQGDQAGSPPCTSRPGGSRPVPCRAPMGRNTA
jgi:small conductance mechanosensitive channel